MATGTPKLIWLVQYYIEGTTNGQVIQQTQYVLALNTDDASNIVVNQFPVVWIGPISGPIQVKQFSKYSGS